MEENPSIEVEYNLNSVCRCCLRESENLSSMFDVIAFNNLLPLNELITQIAQIQVSEEDEMPNKICETCTKQLNSAYDFKVKCEASDFALKKYILKKDPNKVRILSSIKQEDEFHLSIKPEISIVEDDPLNEDFYENITKRNIIKTSSIIIDDDEQEDNDCLKDDPDYSEENIDYKAARNEQGRYNCHICEKTLADQKGLKLHIRLHTGQNLKRCNICNRGFAKKNHLTRHMDTHKQKVLTCVHCDDTFSSNHELKIHLTLNNVSRKKGRTIKKEPTTVDSESEECEDSKEKIAACKICDATFNKISVLRIHLQTHSNIDTFNNIDLQTKLFLFDLTKVTPSLESHEQLINYIMQDINDGMLTRFYQITNQNGFEYSLSDSETESESEDISADIYIDKKPIMSGHACVNCDKIFDRSYKINQHMKFEHPENEFLYPCNFCQRYFSTEFLLTKHLKSQCDNKIKQYSCTSCKLKFMWQTSYETHNEKLHSSKRAKKTKTIKNKSRDRTAVKEKPKEKNFICQICSKAFFRQEHLDRHVKIHIPSERKFECTICEKKFNRKDNLRSHMRVHKEEKEDCDKHLCVYCGRSFSNSSNLIVHMRRHTGEKPYKCDLCDKGFPRSSDLQCHRRTHTGEKPCLCTICGKGFSRSNKLVRHMRIHTGIRPYKCTHCDRAFTQSNDLTLHIRRHTGEKPYVCGICGDRFIQGTALQTHRRMQGHYEEINQPAPFSSISVNNPNRFTNANRVNRIGLTASEVKQNIKNDIISPATNEIINPATTTTIANVSTSNSSSSASSRMLPGFGIHGMHGVPNGVPFLSNAGVLMQNLEVSTTIFSISAYNQGFN